MAKKKKNKTEIEKNKAAHIDNDDFIAIAEDVIVVETVEVNEELSTSEDTVSEEGVLLSSDIIPEAMPFNNDEPSSLQSNKVTDLDELESALEAIIFAAPKALTLARLKQILNNNNYESNDLKDVLSSLQARYEDRGMQLVKAAGGYQFRTHPKHAAVLGKLLEDKPARLSPSALEVLAITAYKQPITRAEIDAIRGIDSGHLLKGLLEKNVVRTMGHSEAPGRPLLYGSTPYFLEVFGLNSLDDLPSIEEFERELQTANGVEGEEGAGASVNVLEADPDFFDKASPLAANPDRGDFDEPAEDIEERPNFGLSQHVEEDLANNEDGPDAPSEEAQA